MDKIESGYNVSEVDHERIIHMLAQVNQAKILLCDYNRAAKKKSKELHDAAMKAEIEIAKKNEEFEFEIKTKEGAFTMMYDQIKSEVIPKEINPEDYTYDDKNKGFIRIK